jgi:hypothetical protein
MAFQSSHPSRNRTVGGRSGTETLEAVLAASAVLLAASLYAKHRPEFLREMASALDSLFGARASSEETIVAASGSILRAKCAPATDREHGRSREGTERKAA